MASRCYSMVYTYHSDLRGADLSKHQCHVTDVHGHLVFLICHNFSRKAPNGGFLVHLVVLN